MRRHSSLSWFRRQRRGVALIAAVTIGALAAGQFVCPWPIDGSQASAPTAQPFRSAAPSVHPCEPEACACAHDVQAAAGQRVMTSAAPLFAALVIVWAALSIASGAALRTRTFSRLPGFPFFLAFYRLRI